MSEKKHCLPSPPLNLFSSQSLSIYRVLYPPFSFRVSLSGGAISSRSISCCRSELEEELSPGKEEKPRAEGSARKQTLHQGWKTPRNNKGDASRGEQQSPVGRLLPRPSAEV